MKIIKLIIKELPFFGFIWSLLSILAYSQKGIKGNEPIFQDYNILKFSFLIYTFLLFFKFLDYVFNKKINPYLCKITIKINKIDIIYIVKLFIAYPTSFLFGIVGYRKGFDKMIMWLNKD